MSIHLYSNTTLFKTSQELPLIENWSESKLARKYKGTFADIKTDELDVYEVTADREPVIALLELCLFPSVNIKNIYRTIKQSVTVVVNTFTTSYIQPLISSNRLTQETYLSNVNKTQLEPS